MAGTRKAAPKRPATSDHRKKATPDTEEVPEGVALLKDINDVPVWEQTALNEAYAQMVESGGFTEGGDEQELSGPEGIRSVNLLYQVAYKLMDFAIDQEAWAKFCSGQQSEVIERVSPVITHYMGLSGNTSP